MNRLLHNLADPGRYAQAYGNKGFIALLALVSLAVTLWELI